MAILSLNFLCSEAVKTGIAHDLADGWALETDVEDPFLLAFII